MTGSVYQKTALPAKLDLTKYNTREQLRAEQDPKKANRGGTGKETAASVSQQDCNEVMRKDLRDWLVKHDIHGPPPNAVVEQKAMWDWIRDFHNEYSDDWFSRNMPRLHEQFKPIFVSEMKAMKAAASKTSANTTSPVDMLDLDTPAVTSASTSSTSKPVGGTDLLDISEPTPAPVAKSQGDLLMESSVIAPAPTTATANLSDSLLSLDLGGPTAAPPAPAVTVASNDLLGGLQFGPTEVKAQPMQPSVPVPASSDLGLIDFGAPSVQPTPQSALPTAMSSSGYSIPAPTLTAPSDPFPPMAQFDNLLSQASANPPPKEAAPTSNSSSKELNLLDLL